MDKRNLNRLKVVLAEAGKTNKWLSERLGVSDITVSRWTTNKSQPSLESLFLIAKYLEVDVRSLIQPNIQH